MSGLTREQDDLHLSSILYIHILHILLQYCCLCDIESSFMVAIE